MSILSYRIRQQASHCHPGLGWCIRVPSGSSSLTHPPCPVSTLPTQAPGTISADPLPRTTSIVVLIMRFSARLKLQAPFKPATLSYPASSRSWSLISHWLFVCFIPSHVESDLLYIRLMLWRSWADFTRSAHHLLLDDFNMSIAHQS